MPKRRFRSKLDEAVFGVTFDDLLLLPQHSKVLPVDIDVSTYLGNIRLSIPLISAAMDTVSEKEFAAALAREGGLAIIHKNLTVDERVEHIQWVKRRESGIIYNPVTLSPDATVGQAKEIMWDLGISGIPIMTRDNKIAGIITKRDVRFAKNLDEPVSARMTEWDALATLPYHDDWDPAKYVTPAEDLMDARRIEKVLIVRDDRTLEGLITEADIEKVQEFPLACRDSHGRLRVGVAVGVDKQEIDGVQKLLDAGADVICIDTAHGDSKGVLDAIKKIRKEYGKSFVLMAGNYGTYEGVMRGIKAGADVAKVGVGPGSICTTRIISGVGVPQLMNVDNAARAVYDSGRKITLVADGGIKYSGDVTKALAAGANVIMIGSLFAGVDEAPGDIITYQGKRWKTYRGMGSLGAMQKKGGKDRYKQGGVKDAKKLVPEGIEGRVPYRGPLADQVHQLVGGLKSGMGYVGAKNIAELHKRAKFVRVSPATAAESHVHGVLITEEAPNYSQG
ncbi:IMP dehydrogenase [Candidatus Woesearchaeota archaeon]|nr:IMP dehydrogenase [Candidatus Woesearchaeota archaeon]